jgi:hypothetical protein
MPQRKPESGEPSGRVTITGELDRQTIEAIKLEVRRLAHRFGLDIREAPSTIGS